MEIEKTYLKKVTDWLNADPSTRSLEDGARLMLQGNRNRILHQNVLRRNNVEKVVYELGKIVATFRQAEPVNVQKLEAKVYDLNTKAERTGTREDHDALPEYIQCLIGKNLSIYHEMRSLHERVKILSENGHTPEERLPFLTELLAMDALLTANWKAYDEFGFNVPVLDAKKPVIGEKLTSKQVSANRKFLSDNKSKIWKLREDAQLDKADALLVKMQDRYDAIIAGGETFAPEQTESFKTIGINV